jgi:hypothetical protein
MRETEHTLEATRRSRFCLVAEARSDSFQACEAQPYFWLDPHPLTPEAQVGR